MTSEKSFQAYFMKVVDHGYRTALTTGGGFPDVLLIHGDRYSLVELKVMNLGPSGDMRIGRLFKLSQPPWYMSYLAHGGTRLFVVFKLLRGYGVLHVSEEFVRNVDRIKYSDLPCYKYREYKTLKQLLKEHFV